MDETIYETTPLRAIPALFAGVAAATAVIVLALALLRAVAEQDGPGVLTQAFNAAVIMTPLVFMFLFVGAVFVAAPSWWVLHRMERRSRADAMVLGAMLCAAGAYVPVFRDHFAMPPGEPVGSAAMALAGAVAGMVAWRIAYREGPAGSPA